MDNDYKRLWNVLQKQIREMGDQAKNCAIKTFENDNAQNLESPIESRYFIEEMTRMQVAENIIGIMSRIEIGELLFIKHEEKCKSHYEKQKE